MFFPTNRGAYWLVRGKLGKEAEARVAKAASARGTWRQGPLVDASWMPNPSVAPELKPDGMSLMHWLGETPLVWFVKKEYTGG